MADPAATVMERCEILGKVAELAPIAMLFVRCPGGISHNPAESVSPEDVAAAIEATSRFLDLVAETRS